jgi:HAMP domain-containing protein
LTSVADRISVGDLDVSVTGIKSRDEIGDLALAIKRMQESIRLAIKRMRERG